MYIYEIVYTANDVLQSVCDISRQVAVVTDVFDDEECTPFLCTLFPRVALNCICIWLVLCKYLKLSI